MTKMNKLVYLLLFFYRVDSKIDVHADKTIFRRKKKEWMEKLSPDC